MRFEESNGPKIVASGLGPGLREKKRSLIVVRKKYVNREGELFNKK
jgi:hypothetical protein